jgi:hypothetical protein
MTFDEPVAHNASFIALVRLFTRYTSETEKLATFVPVLFRLDVPSVMRFCGSWRKRSSILAQNVPLKHRMTDRIMHMGCKAGGVDDASEETHWSRENAHNLASTLTVRFA